MIAENISKIFMKDDDSIIFMPEIKTEILK